MLTWICQYLRNWFDYDSSHSRLKYWDGTIEISGGKLQDIDLAEGQYFRIVDSLLNDGVHNTSDTLTDETFTGIVQSMRIPPDLIAIDAEMEALMNDENFQKALKSPYQSESILGVYSYTLKTGVNASGAANDSSSMLINIFKDRLAPWRKI